MGGQSSRLISPHTLPLHVQYPVRRDLAFLGAGNEAAVQHSRSRYIQAGFSSKPGPHIYYGMGLCTFNSFAVYARLPRYLRNLFDSSWAEILLSCVPRVAPVFWLSGNGTFRIWCYKVL